MSYLKELHLILPDLPVEVAIDINSRIKDWFESGGSEEDEYINTQLNYAKRVYYRDINNKENKF